MDYTNIYWVAFQTILRKETMRFLRIWIQTLLPPAITMTLYFLIFGSLLGSQIGDVHGFSYMQYIAPGLIMMSVITNAYANVVSSFFGMRFQKSVEELLIAPLPPALFLLGFIAGGILRGLLVGLIVTVIALFFTHLTIHNILTVMAVVLLAATLFALAGFTNALFAKKFDDITIVPTFILTPLTYLGGVFYSIQVLPDFWRHLSFLNPILYMVNAFRYGILGVSDVSVMGALSMLTISCVVLFGINVRLLQKGVGIRS
jgi:ABC-2 type transport system permease protein